MSKDRYNVDKTKITISSSTKNLMDIYSTEKSKTSKITRHLDKTNREKSRDAHNTDPKQDTQGQQ